MLEKRVARGKERGGIKTKKEERVEAKASPVGGGGELEAHCQSLAGVSSSARLGSNKIVPITNAWLSKKVAKAYAETRQREEELRKAG